MFRELAMFDMFVLVEFFYLKKMTVVYVFPYLLKRFDVLKNAKINSIA